MLFVFWVGFFLNALFSTIGSAEEAKPEFAFDIPAQPLEQAIHAFVDVSGVQVLYETALTSGRQSAAIRGRFTAEDALHNLLRGTALRAKTTTAEAFTILAESQVDPSADQGPAKRIDMQRHGAFLGAAQADILYVLCRSAMTRPGPYEIKLRIWIDLSGKVTEAVVTKSTGEIRRDTAIAQRLRGLVFSEPLPVDLPQPLGMVIAPLDPKKSGDCIAADTEEPSSQSRARNAP